MNHPSAICTTLHRSLLLSVVALILTLAGPAGAAKADEGWADPDQARAEDPDFSLQGEYLREAGGLQVLAMGEGNFLTTFLPGGLPGQGWDGKTTEVRRLDSSGVKTLLRDQGYRPVTRTSPTLGAKPPANAIVLFDGSNTDNWVDGHLDGSLLESGANTKHHFKSFKLHIEFRVPHKPKTRPSSQDRGNSGIYIFNRYETQVLDSFGLHYYHIAPDDKNKWKEQFKLDLGFNPESDRTQWCGCFYKLKTPAVNASFPPLTWQTYDITFTAPTFDGERKTANARMTVIHNGIKIQDDVELPKGTGVGGSRPEVASEAIYLQGHGNPVRYRNIWLVEN